MNFLILGIIALVLIVVVVILARRSRSDGVGDFQRQINALSPEARRPVVDQVHKFEDQAAEPEESESTERPDGT
jgi:hypothetical protein